MILSSSSILFNRPIQLIYYSWLSKNTPNISLNPLKNICNYLSLSRIDNWTDINKEINSRKVNFSVKLIFESAGDKLVLGQFLPIKHIPRLLSSVGISGNDIPRPKLF